VDVRWDRKAIAALAGETFMRRAVDDAGRDVAETARRLAPKRTGAGAASIFHKVEKDRFGWSAVVSWDRAHDYMFHVETGTSEMPARPFLRPAIKKKRR
jgi:HK97 gp10 family phage protein